MTPLKFMCIEQMFFDWQSVKVQFFNLRAFFRRKSTILEVTQKLQITRYVIETSNVIYCCIIQIQNCKLENRTDKLETSPPQMIPASLAL